MADKKKKTVAELLDKGKSFTYIISEGYKKEDIVKQATVYYKKKGKSTADAIKAIVNMSSTITAKDLEKAGYKEKDIISAVKSMQVGTVKDAQALLKLGVSTKSITNSDISADKIKKAVVNIIGPDKTKQVTYLLKHGATEKELKNTYKYTNKQIIDGKWGANKKDKKNNNESNSNYNDRYSSNTDDSETSYVRLSNIEGMITKIYGKNEVSKVDKEFAHMLRSKMLTLDNYDKMGSRFNRMRHPNDHLAIANTKEYLFFTKPDLNILNPITKKLNPELSNTAFWTEMFERYRRIISDLQVSARRSGSSKKNIIEHDKHVFIPLLTNYVDSVLDLPAVSADTVDTSQTIYGTSIQYRKASTKSDEGYDFSLDFKDCPWLDLYYFFKMWDEYETLKDIGYIGPPSYSEDRSTTGYYRVNKILHDQIAIYKIVVDAADMETILFYAKLTGCFPKSVPRDALASFKGDGLISYSIDWHAQFVEDSNPDILYDFNECCYSYFGGIPSGKPVEICNSKMEINGGLRRHPFIVQVKDDSILSKSRYLLKWYD